MTDTERLLKAYYTKVLEVDLNADTFHALCLDQDERIASTAFTDWIRIFADEGNVPEAEKERFIEAFNRLSLIELMKTKDTVTINYLRKSQKNKCYYITEAEIFRSTKWSENNPIVIVAIHCEK